MPLTGLSGKESFQPAASLRRQRMLVASERSVVTRPLAELLARVMRYHVHTRPQLMLERSQKRHLWTALQNMCSPLNKRDKI